MAKGNPFYPDIGMESSSEFFNMMVISDMNAFRDSPGVREALHLAFSLNSLLDWHFHSTKKMRDETPSQVRLKKFRSAIELECPPLAIIRDLCDASKHCGINRPHFEMASIKFATGKGGYGGNRAYFRVRPDTGRNDTAGDTLILRVFGPGQSRGRLLTACSPPSGP